LANLNSDIGSNSICYPNYCRNIQKSLTNFFGENLHKESFLFYYLWRLFEKSLAFWRGFCAKMPVDRQDAHEKVCPPRAKCLQAAL
jgi:hypothetical protein